MSTKKSTSSKAIKSTAAVGSALAVAFMPQYADASVFTVGGDGGTGSVTLSNDGDSTDLGGVLLNSLFFDTSSLSSSFVSTYFSISSFNTNRTAALLFSFAPGALGELASAVRSSVSTSGNGSPLGPIWTFYQSSAVNGAVLGSSDNWVPGLFSVNGVNDGNEIFGWLHVELGSSFGNFDPTIISFTYDDEATDTTPFAKPVGGFSVSAIPEPSSLSLLALLALGAGGLRRHRKCTSESSKSD